MSRRRPRGATPTPTRGRGEGRKVRPHVKRVRRARRDAPVRPAAATAAPPKPARRRLGLLSKVALVAGILVTVLALGGQWLLHRSYFRVQHVTFVGLHHETSAQVLIASGLDQHPTMLGLNPESVVRDLERFAWIDGVSLTKHWPNSVVVRIRESSPVAVAFDSHHQLQFVDRRGRDLGKAPLNANLPTLEYVSPAAATWPFERAGRNAALVAAQLPRAFSAQVSVVSVNWRGAVTLKMTTPVSFVLGPPTQLEAKFVAIASVIAHSTLGPGDVVDVTVPGELAVSGPPPA